MGGSVWLKPFRFRQGHVRAFLRSESVESVEIFALGPKGTNIEQATIDWINQLSIREKSRISLCESPEESLACAREITRDAVIPIFVTCAVYYRLHELFFNNLDCCTFLDYHTMNLDRMQLSSYLDFNELPEAFIIAAHPSPALLALGFSKRIISARSNSDAALLCREQKAHACITTESARQIHGLNCLYDFGCPPMVFFMGTSPHGLNILLRHGVQRH